MILESRVIVRESVPRERLSGERIGSCGDAVGKNGGRLMQKKTDKKKSVAKPAGPQKKKKQPKRKDALNPVFLYEWPKR
jgi:hypothetical protein